MKEFIFSVFQWLLLFIAYCTARASGYLDGCGIDLPWYVDSAFWVAFFMLVLVYDLIEKVRK